MKTIASSMLEDQLKNYLGSNQNMQSQMHQFAQNIDPMQNFDQNYGAAMTAGGNFGSFGDSSATRFANAVKSGNEGKAQAEAKQVMSAQAAEELKEKMINTLINVDRYKMENKRGERKLDIDEKELGIKDIHHGQDLAMHYAQIGESARHHQTMEGLGEQKMAKKASQLPTEYSSKIKLLKKKLSAAKDSYEKYNYMAKNPKEMMNSLDTYLKGIDPSYRASGESTFINKYFGGAKDYRSGIDVAKKAAERDLTKYNKMLQVSEMYQKSGDLESLKRMLDEVGGLNDAEKEAK